MANVVFEDLQLDDAPMEFVEHDGTRRITVVYADTADGGRAVIRFVGVFAQRFQPMPDGRVLAVAGKYPRTVLSLTPSPWAQELRSHVEKGHDTFPGDLVHYLIPSDDGVWELLATGVTLETGAVRNP